MQIWRIYMLICSKCGEEIKTKTPYCPFCGHSTENAINEENADRVKKSFIQTNYVGMLGELFGTLGLLLPILSIAFTLSFVCGVDSIFMLLLTSLFSVIGATLAGVAMILSYWGTIYYEENSKCRTARILALLAAVASVCALVIIILTVIAW